MAGAPDRTIWVDGKLVPWEQATVHLLSHSLQRGSLIFDYMSVHETPGGVAVFRMDEHLERFECSADLVGLRLEASLSDLRAAVLEAVRANPGATAVKVCALIPSVEVDVVPMDPRVQVSIAAYDPATDIVARAQGTPHLRSELRLWVEKQARNRRADIMPPQAKVAANYASPMVAKRRARQAGYDEIVLVDEDGNLAEGPTTNLFLVDDRGWLWTPPETRVLKGITRRSILELAKHEGHTVREDAVRPEALFEATEVFLTATTAGVWPVISVDGQTVGEGTPGPVSLALRQRLEDVSGGHDPAFDHWLAYVEER